MPLAPLTGTHKPHRILRYINIAIGALVLLAGVAVYWYVYRALPQTSGTITAPVTGRVTIARDALGVPHITAAGADDAYFAQGYVHAQDRLFQMDGLRRLAAGDLAEIAGPSALPLDLDSRRLGMRRIAEAAWASLPASDRAPLAAYARGVNFFIRTHLNALPVEFTLLGYQPRPWSAVDTILIGLHMYRDLATSWKDEILKRDMLAAGDRAKVDFLFPVRSGSELQPGSNAWAISAAHTATGKPILCNDTHLEYSMPGIWYLIHLRSPGMDVEGMSLPGAPSVILGHNQRIAWGVTNLHFAVQDLYIETFDPQTGRYLYRGQWEQARREREIILVKGARPVEITVWVTRHGPLYFDNAKEHLALRWTAAEPGSFQFPFPEINRAGNWQEFTRALARYPGPAQNFVYADVDGHIGYHAAGLLPIRKGFTGSVPVDGASGENEWQGFIPFDQLPSSFDPPQGVIVTANQNPFPPDYPYQVSGVFASQYRSRQIRDLLLAHNGWRAGDMLAVEKDVYSAFSHYLAQDIVRAYTGRAAGHSSMSDAIEILRSWNGQMDKDEAAPLIVTLAYEHLKTLVAQSASPGVGARYKFEMAPAVIEKLLRARPPGWFADWDETLLRSLELGLQDGRSQQGRDPNHWTYGRYHPLFLANPVGSHLPVVAGLFDIGPVPMSGSPTTVKQYSDHLGPSMRLDVDLADWDRSWWEGTTGQSGEVLSRHYKDQWDPYYYAHAFTMQYGKVESKEVLTLLP